MERMGRTPCNPTLPHCSGGRELSVALSLLQELYRGRGVEEEVDRRQCLRRKTPNLFGQAASLPEGLGMLRKKPPLPDTLNYNSGALCVCRGR